MSRAVPVLPALALPLVLGGCPGNVTDPFPLSVGFQPLTHCVTADWPAPIVSTFGTDYFPEVVNVVHQAGCGGALNPDTWVVTDQAHGRGYLKKDILMVWTRLKDPSWVHLCDSGYSNGCVDSWTPLVGLEAEFPVSFRIYYHVIATALGISVNWEHTWREGALAGTVAMPTAVGARYQKTWGIENIRVQTGSFVLAPVGPTGEYTSIEMVGWLDADQSNDVTLAGTLVNAYNLLLQGVHTP